MEDLPGLSGTSPRHQTNCGPRYVIDNLGTTIQEANVIYSLVVCFCQKCPALHK